MRTDKRSDVRKAYDRFEMLRIRDKPLDEGDVQNIHLWMTEVTRAIEALAAKDQPDA